MNRDRLRMAMLFPFLAVITIVAFAGGLGVIFMVLNDAVLEEWAVVILGLAIVIGVPSIAAFLQSRVERE